jgi:lysine 2,3-aminomutase
LFDGQNFPEPSIIHHPRISGYKPLVGRRPNTSARVRLFRRAFFPVVSDRDWNDWRWQIRNRIQDFARFERMLALSNDERTALEQGGSMLPVGVTPYYMSLLSHDNPNQPLRRSVIPTTHEFVCAVGESADPLAEEEMSPVPGLVHRYPDRVLLLVSDFCSTYCRYCTRSRVVGHGILTPAMSRLEKMFEYIRVNPQIRDVLVSGGEPLCLSDDRLDWILTELRRIPHVEIVRIGTKAPVVLPQRITPQLTRMLRRHHPIWMSIHFTHPDECTAEASRACAQLADAGIPLGSQTVLLKGINDDLETMKKLVKKLMTMRVRPYYIYQCDPIYGSAHFRTSIEKGLEIIRGLRGFTSGYAVPTFVVDAPGGGGKIPVMPDYVIGREGEDILLRNYEGKVCRCHDPLPSEAYANR